MASWCRWQLASLLVAAVAASVVPPPAVAYYTAQYSNLTVQNQLGPGVRVNLSCYQLYINSHLFGPPDYKWVKMFDTTLDDGAATAVVLAGHVFEGTKAQCEIVVNKKGEKCVWTIFNDRKNFEDSIGYDRAWYLRLDGIYDEITDEIYKRSTKLQYKYCKELQIEDLRVAVGP